MWTSGYYLFHSYFDRYHCVFYIFYICLCNPICFRCLGLAKGLRVQFRGTYSSSNESLTANHAIRHLTKHFQKRQRQRQLRSFLQFPFPFLLPGNMYYDRKKEKLRFDPGCERNSS